MIKNCLIAFLSIWFIGSLFAEKLYDKRLGFIPVKCRTVEVTFSFELLPEDSLATVQDVKGLTEEILKLNKLNSGNYFFELGIADLNPKITKINMIKY